jgi:hypothetical protein
MVSYTKRGQKKIDTRESRIGITRSMASEDDQIQHFISMEDAAREFEKRSGTALRSQSSNLRKIEPSPIRRYESGNINQSGKFSQKSNSIKSQLSNSDQAFSVRESDASGPKLSN